MLTDPKTFDGYFHYFCDGYFVPFVSWMVVSVVFVVAMFLRLLVVDG